MNNNDNVLNQAVHQPTAEEGYRMANQEGTRKAQRVLDWLKANRNAKWKIWAEVEELVYTGYELKTITDRLYGEGEYGES